MGRFVSERGGAQQSLVLTKPATGGLRRRGACLNTLAESSAVVRRLQGTFAARTATFSLPLWRCHLVGLLGDDLL